MIQYMTEAAEEEKQVQKQNKNKRKIEKYIKN
jgi:hypothetical protein